MMEDPSDAEQAIKCFEFPGNDYLLVICVIHKTFYAGNSALLADL